MTDTIEPMHIILVLLKGSSIDSIFRDKDDLSRQTSLRFSKNRRRASATPTRCRQGPYIRAEMFQYLETSSPALEEHPVVCVLAIWTFR
ncbi:hypothetical protein PGQ11_010031 [Apiospora arundinis]|uniref:Uncharacterized protein n=1 Tax=Apiospora arundinis TaxID=335852 RepID=A0ABR2I918_9PEZI